MTLSPQAPSPPSHPHAHPHLWKGWALHKAQGAVKPEGPPPHGRRQQHHSIWRGDQGAGKLWSCLAHSPAWHPTGKGSEGLHIPGECHVPTVTTRELSQSPCMAAVGAPNSGCVLWGCSRRYFTGSMPTTTKVWAGSAPSRDSWGPPVSQLYSLPTSPT